MMGCDRQKQGDLVAELMSCVDGSCDARAFRSFGERGQVQSCVRPVDEAVLPLALMVSADLVPICFADIRCPRH